MSLENPLPGYGPDEHPANVDIATATELAARLKANGYVLVGSSVTLYPVTTNTMIGQIEGSRRVTVAEERIAIAGPLVLEDQVIGGNAIGLWDIQ